CTRRARGSLPHARRQYASCFTPSIASPFSTSSADELPMLPDWPQCGGGAIYLCPATLCRELARHAAPTIDDRMPFDQRGSFNRPPRQPARVGSTADLISLNDATTLAT